MVKDESRSIKMLETYIGLLGDDTESEASDLGDDDSDSDTSGPPAANVDK